MRGLAAVAVVAAALTGAGARSLSAPALVTGQPAPARALMTFPARLAQQTGETGDPGQTQPPRRPPLDARPGAPGDGAGSDPVSAAEGALPGGVVVSDDTWPGVAHLNSDLLLALRAAAADAANDGVTILVTNGWRSPAYQEALQQEAVATYGSEAEAARWVAAPAASAHVTGDAVDLGPLAATEWLAAHGAAYGLCQTYANEPWHYELRPEAVAEGCPAMAADAAHGAAPPG